MNNRKKKLETDITFDTGLCIMKPWKCLLFGVRIHRLISNIYYEVAFGFLRAFFYG